MNVLIVGAAGMIGRKLSQRLARDGRLAGKAIDAAHLVDIVAPEPLESPFPVLCEAFDIAASYVAPGLIGTRSDFKDPGFGIFSGMPREFVLRDPGANLWEGIRDDAVEYFARNRISWWGEEGNEPTGHLLRNLGKCSPSNQRADSKSCLAFDVSFVHAETRRDLAGFERIVIGEQPA